MILKCELNIRPDSLKRIEEKISSLSADEDVLSLNLSHSEREALQLFLLSIKDQVKIKFPAFSASVDQSALLPQLHIREDG